MSCNASTYAITVVIPTVMSPWTMQWALPRLLVSVLRSSLLRHPQSQVIMNHGTVASYDSRELLDKKVLKRLGVRPKLARPERQPMIEHVFGPRAETFAASRFFAAATARNDIIVTFDDDLLNYQLDTLLKELVCGVAKETGFPNYTASRPGLHGNQERFCDAFGYDSVPRSAKNRNRTEYRHRTPNLVLTNFAAFSRVLARRFVEKFDNWYGDFIHRSRGNGEDILFADAAWRLGSGSHMHHLGSHAGALHTLVPSNASYSRVSNHYAVRRALCCCVASMGTTGGGSAVMSSEPSARMLGAQLARCVFEASDMCPSAEDGHCVRTRPTGGLGWQSISA